MKNVLDLVQKALGEKPTAKPSAPLDARSQAERDRQRLTAAPNDFERIRIELELGRGLMVGNGGNFTSLRSTHGTTPEIWQAVRELLPPELNEITTKILAQEKRWRAVFDELGRFASRLPGATHMAHIDSVSEAILHGREIPPAKSRRMIEDEIANGISARKAALRKISSEALHLSKPLLLAAEQILETMLTDELESEITRHKKFGIPMNEASEFLKSIVAAKKQLRSRIEFTGEPTGSPRDMVSNLV